jgi:nucleotide-binding universal stress UspA family protein
VLDAEVIAVHVLGVSRNYLDLRQSSRDALDQSVAPLRDRGIEHRTELMDGSPASALDKLAVQVDADLIVVGRRGSGGFAELLLGSAANALAHHAHRPVLIVPAAQHSAQ